MYLLSTEVILNDQNTAEIIEFAAPASRLPAMRNCPTLNFDTRRTFYICNCGMIFGDDEGKSRTVLRCSSQLDLGISAGITHHSSLNILTEDQKDRYRLNKH
jgi:hypothetical protein